MAYTPTKWQDHIPEVQDGTPVSAVNMNKIEEGIMQAHQVADSTASALDHAYHPLFPYYSAGATGDSTSTIYYTADGLTTGVYLLLSCGYNNTTKQVVYRIKIGTSSSMAGTSGVADGKFVVGFGGMASEIQRTAATAKIFICLSRDSAASSADNWDVRLHKLI